MRSSCRFSPSSASLNALSGIGGVQTQEMVVRSWGGTMRLNALSGIGGVQTYHPQYIRRMVLPS